MGAECFFIQSSQGSSFISRDIRAESEENKGTKMVIFFKGCSKQKYSQPLELGVNMLCFGIRRGQCAWKGGRRMAESESS